MNRKELYILSLGVFLTIIAWLVADILHTATTEKVKAKYDISKPIKYQIDVKVFEKLKTKKP